MSQVIKKFIGDDQVGANKILLENNITLKARNAGNTADIDVLGLDSSNNVNIYNGTGLVVIDCGNSMLVDESANESVDWENRVLFDSAAGGALNFSDTADVRLDASKGFRIGNDKYIKARNGADNADIDLIKLDASDNLTINRASFISTSSSSGLTIDGTETIQISATGVGQQLILISDDIQLYGGNAEASTKWYDADSSHYLILKAPATITTNFTLTFPDNDGSSGQFLQTNGSGVMTWANATSSYAVEPFTLIAGDITNGYVTLSNTPIAASVQLFVSGLKSKYTTDYTVSGAQVNFSTHTPTLAIGDVIEVHYAY